ncbi:MAG: prepilin-type N-terminal cleavage/methylation domain-containing protein [Bacilli bacterium]|nr:prepilin-type N-terminal cleavage/methylation domain-containing protein [Bacilli bacterium]
MKRRGFTLVELLGVVVVLAIVMGLAVVGYSRIRNNVTKTYYSGVEQSVLMSANEYFNYNDNLIPESNGSTNVSVFDLIEKKYIEPIKNQKGVECSESDLKASFVYAYKDANDKIQYEMCLKCGDEYDYTKDKEGSVCQSSNIPLSIQVSMVKEGTKEEYSSGEYTNQNVTINARAIAGSGKIYIAEKVGETYNIKKTCTMSNTTSVCSLDVKSNTTYSGIYAVYGDNTEKQNEEIRIDKTKPTFTINEAGTVLNNGDVKEVVTTGTTVVTNTTVENIADTGSGIRRIRYSLAKDGKEEYVSETRTTFSIAKEIPIGTYKLIVEVTDKAGNVEKKEVTYKYVKNINSTILVCNNIKYNGQTQTLINAAEGITLENQNQVNAGTYTITAKLKDGYRWNDESAYNNKTISCTLSKKDVSVSWGANVFTYNGGSQAPTASVATGVAGETMTITRTTGIDAGSYTSTASCVNVNSGQSGCDNYQLTGNTQNYTINKKSIAVSWGSTTTFTYNGNAQAPTVSINTGVTNETMTVVRTTEKNAGSYTSTASCSSVSGGQKKCDNYTLTSTTKDYTINKKSIAVSWGGTTFTYNGNAQAPTTNADTGVSGETMTVVRTTEIDAGSYTSTASCGSVSGGQKKCENYTLTSTTKDYTINKKSLTVSWGGTTFTYNGGNQAPTASVNTGVSGESMTINRTTEIDAGSYTSTASCGGVTGGQKKCENYTLASTTKDYTINKKSLTVSWGDATFTYNGGNQAPTASVNTGVSGESMTINRTMAIDAGSYTSTASCGGVTGGQAKCDNYTLTGTTKGFTINKKSIAVSWGETTFTYNGASQGPTASVDTGVTGETMSISRTTGIDAKNYTSTASCSSVSGGQKKCDNYTLTGTTKGFTINKKSVTVTWGSTTFTYNGENQGPTASVDTGVTGETMIVTRTTQKNAGSYTSTASCSSVSGGQKKCDNYTLTGNTQGFTINKDSVSCSTSTNNYTYGGTKSTPSVSSNPESGTVTYYYNSSNSTTGGSAWSGLSSSALNVGTYYVYATIAETTNYNSATCAAGSFTISRASVSCSTSTSDYTYGGTKSTPSVSSNPGSGTVTYYYNSSNSTSGGTAWTSITSTSKNAGTHYVYATIAETTNYNSATCSASSYKINKASVSCSTSTNDYTYGGTKSSPSVSSNPGSGTVTYYYNSSNSTSGGTAWTSITSTSKNAGTHYIYATIAETTNYNSATCTASSYTINRASVSCSTSTNNYSYGGTKSTPSVSSNPGSGTVTYYYNTSNSTSGGTAWSSLSSTSYNAGTTLYVYATIPQTTNYNSATCTAGSFSISKASVSCTTSTNNYTYGGTKSSPSISSNPGNGTVTYYYNSSNSTSGGTAWTSITSTSKNAGTHYVYATIAETTNYSSATCTAGSYTINRASVSCSTSTNGYSYGGTKSTPSVSSNPGSGTVTYYYNTSNSTSGGTAWSSLSNTSYNAGTTLYVYATISQTTNYSSATCTTGSFSISRASVSCTTSTNNYTYGGTKSTPYVSSNPGSGTVTYYYNSSNSTSGGTAWSNITSTSKNAGTHYVYATISQTTNYNSATCTAGSYTINKASSSTNCYSNTYDGSPKTLAYGTNCTPTTSSNSGTDAGTYTVYCSANSSNYNDSYEYCTIGRLKTATTGSCITGLTANGSSQTLASGASNATYYYNTGTDEGSYTVYVYANSNYLFSDGSYYKTLSCSIGAAQSVEITCNNYTYTGSAITACTFSHCNSTGKKDYSKTYVGDYKAYCSSAESGYTNPYNSSANGVSWSISKSETTTSLSNKTVEAGTAASGATSKLKSNQTSISGGSYTYEYYTSDNYNLCINGNAGTSNVPTSAGTYYVKATLNGTDNYYTSSSGCATYTYTVAASPDACTNGAQIMNKSSSNLCVRYKDEVDTCSDLSPTNCTNCINSSTPELTKIAKNGGTAYIASNATTIASSYSTHNGELFISNGRAWIPICVNGEVRYTSHGKTSNRPSWPSSCSDANWNYCKT